MEFSFNIYIGARWESLDHYGDCPAMTFQMNNLGEFKDRNADYSQTVKLPKSPVNMRALGLGLGLESRLDYPYNSYKCVVFVDGSRVTPLGSVFIISALTQDDIEGQILGPAFDLINTLNNKSCISEEAEGFWWSWWKDTPQDTFYLENGFKCFAFIATWAQNMLAPPSDAGVFSGVGPYTISILRLFPVLPLLNLTVKIFELEGWTVQLKGDYLNNLYDDPTSPACVACAPIQANDEELPYYFSLIFQTTYDRGGRLGTWVMREMQANGYPTPEVNSDKSIVTYRCLYSGTYSVKVVGFIDEAWFDGETTTSYLFLLSSLINVYNSAGALVRYYRSFRYWLTTEGGREIEIETFSMDLLSGYILEISVDITQLSTADVKEKVGEAYVYIDASANTGEGASDQSAEPVEGLKYDLLNSLNFANRGEIVTECMRLMGIIMQVDIPDQIIYLFGFDYLLGRCNESECVDWSAKLIFANIDWRICYTPDGYGRQNTVKLKDDTDNNLSSKWTFSLNNAALEASKDLWESKALAIGAYSEAGSAEGRYANYPLVEIDREEGEENWKGTNDVLLVRGSSDYEKVYISHVSSSGVDTVELRPGRAFRVADFLPSAYSSLLGLLYQYKELEAYFDLSAADIEGLDLTRPVWLGEFGHFFYIQKVNNYQPGKLTKVNLCLLK